MTTDQIEQLFQITHLDLVTLETELPELMSAAMPTCNDPMIRKRWQMVKSILSNVRWNYGPPDQVKIIQP